MKYMLCHMSIMLKFPTYCLFSCFSHFWVFGYKFINTSAPEQNGQHFADDIYKWIPLKYFENFTDVPKAPIFNHDWFT